jgi:hypothetical protein
MVAFDGLAAFGSNEERWDRFPSCGNKRLSFRSQQTPPIKTEIVSHSSSESSSGFSTIALLSCSFWSRTMHQTRTTTIKAQCSRSTDGVAHHHHVS